MTTSRYLCILGATLALSDSQVWLGNGADPYQPKVLRSAAGVALALPIKRFESLGPRLQDAREQGLQVVAAAAEAPTAYWEVDWTRPTVLLLGNEGAGIAMTLRDHVDIEVRIPHAESVESLNVAVAAALLMFERRRQQQAP